MDQFALFLLIALGIPSIFIVGVPPLAKALTRRLGGSEDSDDETVAEVEALRAEVEALRALAPRVMELEERMDFTERLLAQNREPERLEG